MKKKILVLLVVLTITTMLFSTAAVPRSISFESFRHVPGKGYVVVFDTKGQWRSSELWGFVTLSHRRQIDMDCNFLDDTKVSCVVANGIHQYEGRNVKVVLYGYAFPVTVPVRISY